MRTHFSILPLLLLAACAGRAPEGPRSATPEDAGSEAAAPAPPPPPPVQPPHVGDVEPLRTSPLPLPGRAVSLEDAARGASSVVIATLLDEGRVDIGAPGQAIHQDARARVTETLSGAAQGEIVFDYFVQAVPEDIAEADPHAGTSYLLCLSRRGTELRVVKMAPAEDRDRAARALP